MTATSRFISHKLMMTIPKAKKSAAARKSLSVVMYRRSEKVFELMTTNTSCKDCTILSKLTVPL